MKYLSIFLFSFMLGLLQVYLVQSQESLSLIDTVAKLSLIYPAGLVVTFGLISWQLSQWWFEKVTYFSLPTMKKVVMAAIVFTALSPAAAFTSAVVIENNVKPMFPFQSVNVKVKPRGYYIQLQQTNEDLSVQKVQVLLPFEDEDNYKVVVSYVYNHRARILEELNKAPKLPVNGIKTVAVSN